MHAAAFGATIVQSLSVLSNNLHKGIKISSQAYSTQPMQRCPTKRDDSIIGWRINHSLRFLVGSPGENSMDSEKFTVVLILRLVVVDAAFVLIFCLHGFAYVSCLI